MEIWDTLGQLLWNLGTLVVELVLLASRWWLLIAWVAWWLLGVNWRKAWAVLGQGAWAPAVVILVVAALVWSRLAPSSCACLGFVIVPNFWWQLGAVGLLMAVTLFCGWLQGLFGWYPPEIGLEPPAHAHGPPGHGHEAGDHGHWVS